MGDDKLIGRWIGCAVLSVRRAVNRCHNHQLNQFAFFGLKVIRFVFVFFFFFGEKRIGSRPKGRLVLSFITRRERRNGPKSPARIFFFSPRCCLAGSIYRRPEEEERYERSSIKEAPVIV